MPIKSCSSGGRPGKRWGNHGKCYRGPGATAKAAKQAAAAHANGYHAEKPRKFCQTGENAGKPGVCPKEGPAPSKPTLQRKPKLLARAGKPGRVIRQAKVAEHRLLSAIKSRVPPKLQAAAGLAVKAIASTWIPAQRAAYAVAREVGGERHAKKVSRALIAADLLAAKTLAPAIGAVSGGTAGTVAYMTPLASSMYLAFSTARHPVATWNAARKAIQGAKKAIGQLPHTLRGKAATAHAEGHWSKTDIRAVLAGYEKAGTHVDWYESLLFAALPEVGGNLSKAALLAGKAMEGQPRSPLASPPERFSEQQRALWQAQRAHIMRNTPQTAEAVARARAALC